MTALFLLLLGLLEYLVFSDSFSQFFQGDALFCMGHRFRSWNEFFQALVTLDISHWYRPLSNRTIPSLFFPWFGLNPYGYHWVMFLLFFTTTCSVFFFLRHITKSFIAAAAGTVFFSLHSINVYTTYDFAFAPELLYATFYILSCMAYLKQRYVPSILFFILALMSKEAAVTLPAIILFMSFFGDARAKKYVLPFFGILGVYYLYFVRFLRVGTGDYALAFHKDVLPRLRDSFLWAFNLRLGATTYAAAAAAIVAVAVGVYAATALFGPRRRFVLLGLGWFVAALSPMLGIVSYFGGYYLFLPLVGIALIVGECFRYVHAAASRFNPHVATAVVCLGLLPFIVTARVNAQSALYTNSALGYAGRIAEKSIRDLIRLHPVIPAGSTIYIDNSNDPDLWRFYGLTGLFKLFYADDSLDVRYSSLGETVPQDLLKTGKAVVVKYENGGLIDATASVVFKSEQDFQYDTSDQLQLEVFPTEVAAGKGSYSIRISGAANTDAELQYHLNEGPLAFTTIHLNPKGTTGFFVSNETKRGIYRFVAFRILPTTTWIRAAGSVTVTD